MLSLSARVEGSNRVTLHKVSNAGLVVNAGDVPESMGDLSHVMYLGSELEPSGVICVCTLGDSK